MTVKWGFTVLLLEAYTHHLSVLSYTTWPWLLQTSCTAVPAAAFLYYNLIKSRIAASVSVGLSDYLCWFYAVNHHCNSFSCYCASLAETQKKKKRESKDGWFDCFSNLIWPVWYFSNALQWSLTVLLFMEALDNAWYSSWRPLTNLTQTFWACHSSTFKVVAIL